MWRIRSNRFLVDVSEQSTLAVDETGATRRRNIGASGADADQDIGRPDPPGLPSGAPWRTYPRAAICAFDRSRSSHLIGRAVLRHHAIIAEQNALLRAASSGELCGFDTTRRRP